MRSVDLVLYAADGTALGPARISGRAVDEMCDSLDGALSPLAPAQQEAFAQRIWNAFVGAVSTLQPGESLTVALAQILPHPPAGGGPVRLELHRPQARSPRGRPRRACRTRDDYRLVGRVPFDRAGS